MACGPEWLLWGGLKLPEDGDSFPPILLRPRPSPQCTTADIAPVDVRINHSRQNRKLWISEQWALQESVLGSGVQRQFN